MNRTVAALPILLLLTSCNARWQSLDSAPPPATEAADLHDFSGAGRAQGHRDFPMEFEAVWHATVETLHSRGVGVPKSVQPDGHRVHMDLDALHLLIEQRVEDRVCVLVRFRALAEDEGTQESLRLLDEIHARLLGS